MKQVLGSLVALALALTGTLSSQQTPPDDSASTALDSLLNVRIGAASRYAQVAARAPAFVTLVTAEEIDRYGYRTLDEALQSVPGFSVTTDRNYTYVGTRGLSRPSDYNNRVLLLLNGVPQNETFYNSMYGDRTLGIDLFAVERIEIVRGPASALYGTGAMFAVINVVTKAGRSISGGRATVAMGSHGSREANATVGTDVAGWEVTAAATSGRSDGATLRFPELAAQDGGVARGLDWERFEGVLLTAARAGWQFQARASSRDKGIPTASWGSTFNDARARTNDEFLATAISYSDAGTRALSWSARAHAGRYRYDGAYPSDVLYTDENLGAWAGGTAQFVLDIASSHRLSAGAEATHSPIARYRASDGTTMDTQDYPFTTWSAFVTDELAVGSALTLIGGLRLDGHSELSRTLSSRIGTIITPTAATTIKLLWGEGFRAPSVYERRYESASHSRPAELARESVRTTELVVEQRVSARSQFTLSLFNNDVRDLVDFIAVNDDTTSFANVGEARTRGVELLMQGRFTHGVSAFAGLAYTEAQDGSGVRLTNAPRFQLKLGSAVPGPWGSIATEMRFEGSRRTIAGSETEPALLLDANYRSPIFLDGARFTIRVTDLLNSGFAAPAGLEHIQSVIPQGPRELRVGFSYAW